MKICQTPAQFQTRPLSNIRPDNTSRPLPRPETNLLYSAGAQHLRLARRHPAEFPPQRVSSASRAPAPACSGSKTPSRACSGRTPAINRAPLPSGRTRKTRSNPRGAPCSEERLRHQAERFSAAHQLLPLLRQHRPLRQVRRDLRFWVRRPGTGWRGVTGT